MFRTFSVASAVLALGAAVAHAQSFSLSQECQSTIFGVLATPDAQCLNSAGLLSIITSASASPTSSLVGPIGGWLPGLCSATPCSNDALANITTSLLGGCSSDLADLGVTDDSSDLASTVVPVVQSLYPTLLDIMCLEETGNTTYCVNDLLNDWQNAFGTLSVSAIESDVSAMFNGQTMSVPSSISCNECIQAAYSILETQQPSLASSTVDVSDVDPSSSADDASFSSVLSSQCGSDFLSSPSPTNVVVATGASAVQNASNGAKSTLSGSVVVGVTVSSLTALMGAFFVLA